MGKRKDHIKVAEGLARGLSKREAVRQAGYSSMTADKKAYAIVKRPLVQSALTEALERQGVTMERIIKPVIDALDAPMIVKSTTEGIATIARDPETQEIIPDHRIRLEAHDRLVSLYGGTPRASEIPPPPPGGLTVIIQRDGPPADRKPIDVTPKNIHPTGEAKAKLPARIERA